MRRYLRAISAKPCGSNFHTDWGTKKNDASNPNNLWNLGEFRVGIWEPVPLPVKSLGSHPSMLLRSPAELPSGLFNLGATCYLNAQLQVLYHCLEFRSAIYAWCSPDTAGTSKGQSAPAAGDAAAASASAGSVLKTAAMRHAQLRAMQQLFATMQLSAQRCVSTAPFAAVYNLASGVQQDVQEFFKLFVTHVEESLSTTANPTIRNVLQRQFRGQASWVNNCLTCDYSSCNSEAFYELQVQTSGLSTLHDSLHDFCEVVSLSGSARYACPQCDTKRDAVRFQRIDSLPPVLHVQLSRYGYDYATGQKKKHHDAMHVPDILNMTHVEQVMLQRRADVAAAGTLASQDRANGEAPGSPPTVKTPPPSQLSHGPSTEAPQLYELCAVLYHHGRSANYGHYTCDVWDAERAAWFHFDDALVTQLTPPSKPHEWAQQPGGASVPSAGPSDTPSQNTASGAQKRGRSSTKNTKNTKKSKSTTKLSQGVDAEVLEVEEEAAGGCQGDTLGEAAFRATTALRHQPLGTTTPTSNTQWCKGCVPCAASSPEPAVAAAKRGVVPLDISPGAPVRDFASRLEAQASADNNASAAVPSAYASAAAHAYPGAGPRCTPEEYADWCARRRHPGMSSGSGSGTRTAYMLVYKRVAADRAKAWHTMQCAVGAGQVSQRDVAVVAELLAAASEATHISPQQSQDSLCFSHSSGSAASGPSVAFDSQELVSATGSQSDFLSPRPPRHSPAPAPATASAVKRACAAAAERAQAHLQGTAAEIQGHSPASSLQDLQAPPMQDTTASTPPAHHAGRASRRRAGAAQRSYVDDSDEEQRAAAKGVNGGDLRSMLTKMAAKSSKLTLTVRAGRSRSSSIASVTADSEGGSAAEGSPKRRRTRRSAAAAASAAQPDSSQLSDVVDASSVASPPLLPVQPCDYQGTLRYAADVLPPPPTGPYVQLEEHTTGGGGDIQEVHAPAAATAAGRRARRQPAPAAAPPTALPLSLLPPEELCSSVAIWNTQLAHRAAQWVRAAHRGWALALARRELYMAVFASDEMNPHASCSAVTVTSLQRAADSKKPQWYWLPTSWLRAWIAGQPLPETEASTFAAEDGDPSAAAKPSAGATAAAMLHDSTITEAAGTGNDDVVALDGSDEEGGEGGGTATQPPDSGGTSPSLAQAEELRQRLASLLHESTRIRYSPQDRLAAPGFSLFAPLPLADVADEEPEVSPRASGCPRLALVGPSAAGFAHAVDTPPLDLRCKHLLTGADAFHAGGTRSASSPAAGNTVMLPFVVPRAKRVLAAAYAALVNDGGTAALEILGEGAPQALSAAAWELLCAWAAGDTAVLEQAVQGMKRIANSAAGGGTSVPVKTSRRGSGPVFRLPWVEEGANSADAWMENSWLTRPVQVQQALHSGNFISPAALQLWIDTLSASRSNHSDTAQLIALLSEAEAPVPSSDGLACERDRWVTACLQELRTLSGGDGGGDGGGGHHGSGARAAAQALRNSGVGAVHLFPLASDCELDHLGEFKLPNGQAVQSPAPDVETNRTASAGGDSDADSTVQVNDDESPELDDVATGADSPLDVDTSSGGQVEGPVPGQETGHLALMRALSLAASLWVAKDSPEDVFLVSRAFVRALKARAECARKVHASAKKSGAGKRGPKGASAASASLMSTFLAGPTGAEAGSAGEDAQFLATPNADLVGPRGFVHEQVNRRTALYVRRAVWETLQSSYPKAVPVHLLVAQTDPWIALQATLQRRDQQAALARRQAETSSRLLKSLAKRQGPIRTVRQGLVGTAPVPPGTYALVPRRFLVRWRDFINGSAPSHDLQSFSWERWSLPSSDPGDDQRDEWAITLPTHVLAFLSRIAPVRLEDSNGAGCVLDATAENAAPGNTAPLSTACSLGFTVHSSPHATEQDIMAAAGDMEDFDVVPLDEWQDLLRAHPEMHGPVAEALRRSGADQPFHSLVEEDPTPSKRKKKRSRGSSGDASGDSGRAKSARGSSAEDISAGAQRSPVLTVDCDITDVTPDAEGQQQHAKYGGTHGGTHSGSAHGDLLHALSSASPDSDAPSLSAALDTICEGALHPRESAAYRQYCTGLVAPVLRVLPCTKTHLLPAHIISASSTFGEPCPDKTLPTSCVWWTDPPLDVAQLRHQLAAAHAASLDFTGRAIHLKVLAQGALPPGVAPAPTTEHTSGEDATGDIALVQEVPGVAQGSDDEDFVDQGAVDSYTGAAEAAVSRGAGSRASRTRRRGQRDLLQVTVNSSDTPGEVLIKCFQEHDTGLGGRLWFQGAPLHSQLSLAQANVPAGATLYLETSPDGTVDLAAAISAAGGSAPAAPEAGFSGSAFLS